MYDAINCVVLSIAQQEKRIADILNAEGQKLQKGIKCACTVEELLCLNSSVSNTIRDLTNMEIVLTNKLKSVLNYCPPLDNHRDCGNPFCCLLLYILQNMKQ